MVEKKRYIGLAGVLCGCLVLASEANSAVSAGVVSVAEECAPSVHPATMERIVQHESGGNPFAIGVNNGQRLAEQPTSKSAAIQIAQDLQSMGKNFDVGLGQLNSVNVTNMGLSFDQAFDPCENLRASAAILIDCFSRAGAHGGPQDRLRRALSCYNTGSFEKGFSNGYVASVAAEEGYRVPELIMGSSDSFNPARRQRPSGEAAPRPRGGKADAFGIARGGAFDEQPDEAQDDKPSADDQKTDRLMQELVISAVRN